MIELLIAVAAGLATLLWLAIAAQAWWRRDQLMLRVRSNLEDLPYTEQDQSAALEAAFQRVKGVDGGAHIATYEVGGDIGKPKPYQEPLGGAAGEVLISAMAPLVLQLLIAASERVFRTTVIETELSADEQHLSWSATCRSGRARVARVVVTRAVDSPHDLEQMAWELVCRMLVEASKAPGIELAVGTTDWSAFRAHCEGMGLWLDPERTPETESEAGRLLAQAVEQDAGYVAALYNRAAFTYDRRLDWDATSRALEQFRAAYDIAAAADHLPEAARRKLRGYACVGAARCLAMGAHRFGRTHHHRVEEARRFGEQALELLGRTPRALYAAAFSWHCTELLDGLRRGRELYEEILTRFPEHPFPVVLNNLAYVCHRGGEALEQERGPELARSWYEEGLRRAQQARDAADDKHRVRMLSFANTGTSQRLLGRHDAALESYREALGYDPLAGVPEQPGYLEGLAEFAEVLLDQALTEAPREATGEGPDETCAERLTVGLDLHRLALGHASDRGHVWKLTKQTGRCIARKRPALARELKALLERWDELERVAYIEAWDAGLRELVLPGSERG